MAKLGSGQQLSFALGFTDPEISSFKLVEIDEPMLAYLQGGGTLEIKSQGLSEDVSACTSDATYTVTLVESSNTVLLMQDNDRPADAASGHSPAPGERPDCKYTVLGNAPGVLELRRVAPPVHLVRNALASSTLDGDVLSRHRAELLSQAAGSGVGAAAKRPRTSGESSSTEAASSSSDATLGVSMRSLLESVPCSGGEMATCLERLHAVRIPAAYLAFQARAAATIERGGVEPDAQPTDDDDLDAEAAAAAELLGHAGGASAAASASASAVDGSATPCRWLYQGAQSSERTNAPWALLDDDFAFAALQAILRTVALNRWPLQRIPVTEAADQLSLSFPRFIIRHALTVLFGRPVAVGGDDGKSVLAGLHFAPIARAKGLRALMALQMEATTVAAAAGGGPGAGAPGAGAGAGATGGATAAGGIVVGLKRSLSAVHAAASGKATTAAAAARRRGDDDDDDDDDDADGDAAGEDTAAALLDFGPSGANASLLSLLLGLRPGTAVSHAAAALPPSALVSALLRQQAVRVDAFMTAWQRAMPFEMLLPEDSGSGSGSSSTAVGTAGATDSSLQPHKGRLTLSLLDGLVLVETPPAATAATGSATGGAGAGAGAGAGSSSAASGIASVSTWPGAAAPSATVRLFPEHLLSPDPATRFKQLFAARPKWRLPELTPFLRPVAGSKATATAPAVPGKTIDELLLAFSRVTNVAGGDRLFSAR